MAAIVEKLNFRVFKTSKTDVLNWQWVFLEHRDYWLRLQLLCVQSNAATYFETITKQADKKNMYMANRMKCEKRKEKKRKVNRNWSNGNGIFAQFPQNALTHICVCCACILMYYVWYRLFAISKSSFVGRSWVIIRLSYTSAKTLPPFFFRISSRCKGKSMAHNFIPNVYIYSFFLWRYTCGMST